MKKTALSVLLLALLTACASNKPKPEEPTAAAPEAAPAATQTAVVDPLDDPNNADLQKRSAYFPFDIDAVQDADKPMIEAHGKYLKYRPSRNVRVEGNCDERGSNEYNLALGQRRANNVKKALVTAGAKAEQISTVSYGEDKPVATGHDEDSWKQNRRADLNYKAGK